VTNVVATNERGIMSATESSDVRTLPAVHGQFGQTLAFAERTLSSILRAHLAGRDTTPEVWYALQLIATRGPRYPRAELSEVLEGSPNLDAESTRELLGQLETDGLIEGDTAVDLTPDGQAFHRSLRAYIAGPTARLLGQFDLKDVETTVRTLRAVTERALEEPYE
jgi:hypothetical protein